MQITTLPKALDRIADLEEELLQLKQQLGLAAEVTDLQKMRMRWRLTESEARLLAAIYGQRGGAVSKERLMYALYGSRDEAPEPKIIDVMVCRIRDKIGAQLIETLHATGYRLTPQGVTIVEALLLLPVSAVVPEDPPERKRAYQEGVTTRALRRLMEGPATAQDLSRDLKLPVRNVYGMMSALRSRGRVASVDSRRGPDGGFRVLYGLTSSGRLAARELVAAE